MSNVLWALDLNEDGQPIYAHQIVDPPEVPANDAWPPVMTAACGRRFTSAHSHGWWSWPAGELPLQAHAICCRSFV